MRAAVVCALAAVAALGTTAASAGPRVAVSGGRIEGFSDGDLNIFLGIPYAKPPVGDFRWRAPAQVGPWRGVLATTSYSPACYQTDGRSFGPFTSEFVNVGRRSEDCLYLNVWSPSKPGRKRPVLLYIHGGGFGSGSTSVPVYDASGLARKGVVVVTINYRLGVFGFLAHPALTAESPLKSSGNYGILDMIAALKWVRVNIDRFGGDPANVTISGQSAGAAAVSDLLVSPAAKGLFARAVIQSGPALGVQSRTLAQAEKIGQGVSERLGVRSVGELRHLSADALLAATAVNPPAKGSTPQILMAPNVDRKIIAWDPESADSRVISDVPVMAGYNHDEAFIFGAPSGVTPQQFEDYVSSRYGDFAARFLAVYPHASGEEASQSMDDIGRDRYMSQLVLWAERHAAAQKAALYLYEFNHRYPGSDPNRFRAFHTAEVPYVLGALTINGVKFTADDRQVADQIKTRWVNFMTKGEPNDGASPAWPEWHRAPGRIMLLRSRPEMGWPVSSKIRFDVFRDYVAGGGKLSLF